jgi:TonB family protein
MMAGIIDRRSWGILISSMIVSFSLVGHAAGLASSDIDAARNKITECWYVDPNATFTKDMIVDVRTTMSPDGSVLSAEVVDKARAMNDTNYRKFALAAVRAVKTCSPLPMPAGKYDMWKVTTFHFDPMGAP